MFSSKRQLMLSRPRQQTAAGIVALFNASDDTFEMIETLLREKGGQQLLWGHFADLKKGNFDFRQYLAKHNPEVVVFDITPPYEENWHFFTIMRDSEEMRERGTVLTTTNKNRLDEVVGADSCALEIVGKPNDLQQIQSAIMAETLKAQAARLARARIPNRPGSGISPVSQSEGVTDVPFEGTRRKRRGTVQCQ